LKYLDDEEKNIAESYKKGEWTSVKGVNKKKFAKEAKFSLAKNKRINIRLTQKDFNDIQVKAVEEGIPYQTLISSIIHKYNKGDLKTKSA
jgi:predicted DNA binding CopG/RHH family protein